MCSSIKSSASTVVVMSGQPSSRRGRSIRLAGPALAVLLGGACASTDLTPQQYGAGHPGIDRDPIDNADHREAAVTDIRITVCHQTFTAQLADNPTARDLVEQLPLTLRFRDFNSVEKIAKLPRPLSMDGVPAGDDPEI